MSHNTYLIAAFKAGDSTANLHIALDQYSFKLNPQVVNVTHPNCTRNTSLLAVFKAGDSTTNLHTALDQYRVRVEELQEMK